MFSWGLAPFGWCPTLSCRRLSWIIRNYAVQVDHDVGIWKKGRERGTRSAEDKRGGRVEINGKQPREEWPVADLRFAISMAMLMHRFASIAFHWVLQVMLPDCSGMAMPSVECDVIP